MMLEWEHDPHGGKRGRVTTTTTTIYFSSLDWQWWQSRFRIANQAERSGAFFLSRSRLRRQLKCS